MHFTIALQRHNDRVIYPHFSAFGVRYCSFVHQWKQKFGKGIFKFFIFRSLCFDLFILVLSLFAFSTLILAFQHFTRKLCLPFAGLHMRSVTWNRFPIKISLMYSNASPLLVAVTWMWICASLNHRKKMEAEPSWLIPRKLAANL